MRDLVRERFVWGENGRLERWANGGWGGTVWVTVEISAGRLPDLAYSIAVIKRFARRMAARSGDGARGHLTSIKWGRWEVDSGRGGVAAVSLCISYPLYVLLIIQLVI